MSARSGGVLLMHELHKIPRRFQSICKKTNQKRASGIPEYGAELSAVTAQRLQCERCLRAPHAGHDVAPELHPYVLGRANVLGRADYRVVGVMSRDDPLPGIDQ